MGNESGPGRTVAITRREFSLMAAAALPMEAAESWPPKVLLVVAHPDDEYAAAATVYRLAREAGAVVDQVVITNGEGGFRYAALAEQFYGIPLTDERTGRERLPEIRQRETRAAGRVLGIRNHYFLGEKDGGYTLDGGEAYTLWDPGRVERFLTGLLASERYQFVITMVPERGTHGHHKAAADLALKAAEAQPAGLRPVLLGAAAESSRSKGTESEEWGTPWGNTPGGHFEVSRTERFGFEGALDYSIVVNWVIAEHKSQGLFQTDAGRHDVERFWVLGPDAEQGCQAAALLFNRLSKQGADRKLAASMKPGGRS